MQGQSGYGGTTRPRSSVGATFLQHCPGSSQPPLLSDLQVSGAIGSLSSRQSSCESGLGDSWLSRSSSSCTCCSSCSSRRSSGSTSTTSSVRRSAGDDQVPCADPAASPGRSDGRAVTAPAVQQQVVVVRVSTGVQVDSPPLDPPTKTPPPAPAAAPKAPPPPLSKGPAGKGPVGRAPAPPPPPPPRPGQQLKSQGAAAAAAAGPSTQQQFGDIRQNIVAFGQGATRLTNVAKAAEQKASGGVVSTKTAVKGPQGDLASQILAAGQKRSGEVDQVAADAIQYAAAIEAVRVAIKGFKPEGSGVEKVLFIKAFVQQRHAALAGLSDRDAVLQTVPNWPAEEWQLWEAVASSVDKYDNETAKVLRYLEDWLANVELHLNEKLANQQRKAARRAQQQQQPQQPTDPTPQQEQQQQQRRVVDPDNMDLKLTPDDIKAYVQSLSLDEQLCDLTPLHHTQLLEGQGPRYESVQQGLAKLAASSMADDLQELGYSDWPSAGMQQRVLDKLQLMGRVIALATLHNLADYLDNSIAGPNDIERGSAAAKYLAGEQGLLKVCGQFLLRLQQYVGSTRPGMQPLVKELLVVAAVAQAREGADVTEKAKEDARLKANTGFTAAARVEELLAAGLTDQSSVAAVRSELCKLAEAQKGVALLVRQAKAAAEIAASAAALARSRADATQFGISNSNQLIYGENSRLALAARAAEASLQTAQEQADRFEEAACSVVVKATAAMAVAAVVMHHS